MSAPGLAGGATLRAGTEDRLAAFVTEVTRALASLRYEVLDVLALPWSASASDPFLGADFALARLEVGGEALAEAPPGVRPSLALVLRSDRLVAAPPRPRFETTRPSTVLIGTRHPRRDLVELLRDGADTSPGVASNASLRALLDERDLLGVERYRALEERVRAHRLEHGGLVLLRRNRNLDSEEDVALERGVLADVLSGAPLEWVLRRRAGVAR